MTKHIIPVAMISDDNFIMPTCVAITSILLNKSTDTAYRFYIIMAECSDASKEKIMLLNDYDQDSQVEIINASLDKYRDIKQLAHISQACLLKFDICDLIPGYEKILYLDGDIIVRADLWELYATDLENKYAGAVKEYQCMEEDTGRINAGIMLFNAKRIREENLSKTLYETRIALGDRASMDQQTFNIVTNKEYKYLSIKYNCIIGRFMGENRVDSYTIDKINTLYQENYSSIENVLKDARVVHFATSNKPWVYTFNPGAKEWFDYYKKSPYRDEQFRLKTRNQYRIEKMIEAWKKDGFKGVAFRFKDKWIRLTNRKKDNNGNWE